MSEKKESNKNDVIMRDAESLKEEILRINKTMKGDSFDESVLFYKTIIQADTTDQPVIFRYLCELYGSIDSDESFEAPFSKYQESLQTYKEVYGDFIVALLKMLISRNLQEAEFYRELWKTINDSSLFDDEGLKIFALYAVLNNPRIPYFYISRLNMVTTSDEQYQDLFFKYFKDIQRIRFISLLEFEQKTERASVLLREFGIDNPLGNDQAKQEEYERYVMQMVEICNEIDLLKKRLSEVDW